MPALRMLVAFANAAGGRIVSGGIVKQPQDLELLGLVRRVQGCTVPTFTGLLLVGRARLARFPDALLPAPRT